MLHTKVLQDGSKNYAVLVRGVLMEELQRTPIVDLTKLNPAPYSLKIQKLTWFIQEKMGLVLWTSPSSHEPDDLTMILESRGFANFGNDLMLPSVLKGWPGVLYLESINWAAPGKLFHLILDFDKVIK